MNLTFFEQILFPETCVGCGADNGILCPRCAGKLRPDVRFQQGAAVGTIVSLYPYGNPLVRKLIARWKFQGDRRAERIVLARILAEKQAWMPLFQGARTALVPIPTRRIAAHSRGFSPPLAIAKALGKAQKLPIADCLVFVKRVKQQARLAPEQRLKNMRGAFVIDAPLPYPNIVLVDDVITTGATLAAAADALQRAGVQKISALTFAWGKTNFVCSLEVGGDHEESKSSQKRFRRRR